MTERHDGANNGISEVGGISIPTNQQLEVNAVAGNQGGGPIVAVLKLKDPVSCLKEICDKLKEPEPKYESTSIHNQLGENPTYTERVSVPGMLGPDCIETGTGKRKMDAKNEAAQHVLDKLHCAAERNETFHLLTTEQVQQCHKIFKKYAVTVRQPVSTEGSLENLQKFENSKKLPASKFECVDEKGPDHNNIMTFKFKCTQGDHFTYGIGSSKKIAKNVAASFMLDVLRSQVSAQLQH